jgi:Holliday junction resolvase-like predicted endonuclease
MIYNFRCDQDHRAEIIRRIKDEKQISQGWGGGDTDLDLHRESFDFVPACLQRYKPEMKTARVPTNLLRMRTFKDGDILVTPHLPEYGQVIITVLEGDYPDCYEYSQNDGHHQNHRFRLKHSYGLQGNISVGSILLMGWSSKLPALQLPVLQIPDHQDAFEQIIRELTANPDRDFPKAVLKQKLNLWLSNALKNMKSDLRKDNTGRSFEGVCETLLINAGYKILDRNRYDRLGGDVDLICTRSRTALSPFETGQVNLFVQVKKYTGETDAHGIEQLLKMIENDRTADGCVMSLGDGFTADAQKLAEENAILLMDGSTICKLLLQMMISDEERSLINV